MLPLLNHNEKIPVDSACLGGVALALDGELHSALDTCRYLDLDRRALAYKAGT